MAAGDPITERMLRDSMKGVLSSISALSSAVQDLRERMSILETEIRKAFEVRFSAIKGQVDGLASLVSFHEKTLQRRQGIERALMWAGPILVAVAGVVVGALALGGK